jgi:LuxR family maltose regulon positive regulatory protein
MDTQRRFERSQLSAPGNAVLSYRHAKAVMLGGDAIRLEAVCEMALREFRRIKINWGFCTMRLYGRGAKTAAWRRRRVRRDVPCIGNWQADGSCCRSLKCCVYFGHAGKISDQNVLTPRT